MTWWDSHRAGSVVMEGRLMVQNRYLRLEPTAGRLGLLALSAGTLQSAAQRLFDSPQNKDKFLLPPQIHNVRIEHGQLLVTSH